MVAPTPQMKTAASPRVEPEIAGIDGDFMEIYSDLMGFYRILRDLMVMLMVMLIVMLMVMLIVMVIVMVIVI